ncbi:MAG: hypothetical protein AAB383_05865 [Patescibacteria group bacterium]
MNMNLAVALEKLPALREVPSAAQVLKAPDGTRWGGPIKDGEWELVKVGPNEFRALVTTNS